VPGDVTTADVIVDGIALAAMSTYKSKPRGTAGHPRVDVDAVLLVR
jgi:hypothetical protein